MTGKPRQSVDDAAFDEFRSTLPAAVADLTRSADALIRRLYPGVVRVLWAHQPAAGAVTLVTRLAGRCGLQPGAERAPASWLLQGRFASLRDGLRPPVTRPLRQAAGSATA